MFWIIYVLSVIYCVWRMTRSNVKRFGNDPVGATPGLETLAILAMAPVMMIVDVTLTWIRLYSEAETARRKNSSL
jgi:hypothetical protein